jgi:hypothetical protein
MSSVRGAKTESVAVIFSTAGTADAAAAPVVDDRKEAVAVDVVVGDNNNCEANVP